MKSNMLLEEDIPSLIKKLAIPSSTGMFFNTMYNVVDTFYAGLISTHAVAALSLSFMIFFMVVGVGYGFSSGITALIGNALGGNKQKLARLYAHKGIIFIFLVGLVFSAFGFYFAKDLFLLFGAKDSYLDMSLEYIYTIFYGALFFMGNFALNAVLIAKGDTKTYRNSLIFGFFANLILNPLFIYGFAFIPAMGIQGIALATVLIQCASMLYMFMRVKKTGLISFEKPHYFLPDLRIYKAFVEQGMPASLNMLTMAFGSLIITYFVSHYGYKAVAGYGIGFRVEQIMLLPALGISTAVLSIVSNNFGAKAYHRVSETVFTALKYGFGICVIGLVFLYIAGKFLVASFDNDVEVINYGFGYILVEAWVFFAYVILFISVSTLQGVKKPKLIFYVSFYRQILAPGLVFYLVVKYFALDITYLWVALLVITYSAAIFMYMYMKKMMQECMH